MTRPDELCDLGNAALKSDLMLGTEQWLESVLPMKGAK